MAKKVVTMSLEEGIIDKLTKGGEIRLSDAISKLVSDRESDKKVRIMDIKGIFTIEEWMGLANSMNGTIIDDIMRYSKDMFKAHNEDAERYELSFSNMGADYKEVNDKMDGLTIIQCATVLDRIAEFWGNQNGTGIELDKWAQW